MKTKLFRPIIAILDLIFIMICSYIVSSGFTEFFNYKNIGAFVSLVLIYIFTIKFSNGFYLVAICFHFFASPLGSILNLYSNIPYYDKVIHYFSGIVLAYGGYFIFNYLLNKLKIYSCNLLNLIFAFLFSSTCASFWEIYEFTADNLLGTVLQGDNSNTMGDIISGILGALTFSILFYVFNYKKKISNQ